MRPLRRHLQFLPWPQVSEGEASAHTCRHICDVGPACHPGNRLFRPQLAAALRTLSSASRRELLAQPLPCPLGFLGTQGFSVPASPRSTRPWQGSP